MNAGCPDRRLLEAYHIGNLGEEAAEEVVAHLSLCPTCQTALATLEATQDSLLARLRRPEVEAYADEPQCRDMVARVMAGNGETPDQLNERPDGDPSLDLFCRRLIDSGLMAAADVEQFIVGLPKENRPTTARRLAREMHRQGLITTFQAQAVYEGKTRGLVVGNYVVLDKLGEGGMGRVYTAQHRKMKRVVAIKMLPSALCNSPEAVKRFRREVQAAARLSHPNIVTAFDADEAPGAHFLVMEYVEGCDLSALVAHRGPLPLAQAIDYVVQAARGLEYAHHEGVVHRDIKPSNLLVDKKGVVRILDMGLARLEGAVGSNDDGLTRSGSLMGTLDYMAPEQALDTHNADARSDVYSLGCTLYFLLTGRPPYGGDTITKKILAHRENPIPSLRAARSDVPQWLDEAFQRLLAKNPAERPQMMGEVMAMLQQKPLPQSPLVVPVSAPAKISDDDDGILSWQVIGQESSSKTADFELPPEESDWLKPTNRHRGRLRINALFAQLSGWRRIVVAAAMGGLCVGAAFMWIVAHQPKKGILLVDANVPQTTITVLDAHGKVVERRTDATMSPMPIRLSPGRYKLQVNSDWYCPFEQEFSLAPESQVTIHAKLSERELPRLLRMSARAIIFVNPSATNLIPPTKCGVEVTRRQTQYIITASPENIGKPIPLEFTCDGYYRCKCEVRLLAAGLNEDATIQMVPLPSGFDRTRPPPEAVASLTLQPRRSKLPPAPKPIQKQTAEWDDPPKDGPKPNAPPQTVEPAEDLDKKRVAALIESEKRRSAQQTSPGPIQEGKWVDLISHIDGRRDRVEGKWECNATSVSVAQPTPRALLMLPALVDGSYELEAVFRRTAGEGEVGIVFPVGVEQQYLALNAVANKKPFTAIMGINYRQGLDNPTATIGALESNRDYKLLLRVTHDCRRATYDVRLNGNPFVSWNGGLEEIQTSVPRQVPKLRRPAIGAFDSAIHFKELRLRVLNGPKIQPGRGYVLSSGEDYGEPDLPTDLPANHSFRFHHSFSHNFHLIGLRLELDGGITGVQPIYRIGTRRVEGPTYRSRPGRSYAIEARGYALGAIDVCYARGKNAEPLSVERIRALLMRMDDGVLSPDETTLKPWAPSPPRNAPEAKWETFGITAANKCPRVVGITGSMEGGQCRCLGLILASDEPGSAWMNTLDVDVSKIESKPPVVGVQPSRKAPAASVEIPVAAWQGRSPLARAKLAQTQGGSRQSEAAVERGLQWLAAHQRDDGSWCFDLDKTSCRGLCRNSGSEPSTTAATGLALLPFLGAGYTHTRGKHRDVVKKGVYYLKSRAKVTPHGVDLCDNDNMYAHGIATLALCEAYGMTNDESLKDIAQGALRYIVYAQDLRGGGWRYTPGAPGDTTVTGWQLMSLKSGRAARLEVPEPTLSRVEQFFNSVQFDKGSRYGYLTPKMVAPTPEATTAIGLLCRMHLGWHRDRPALYRGVAHLSHWGISSTNMYYDFYATQVLHDWEGPEWQMWNKKMRDYLVATQATESHENGSWYFPDSLGDHGGRLYNTAMALMILEVYYRHMPLYGKGNVPRF